MLEEFYQDFGITFSLEEERQKFVNRINDVVFNDLKERYEYHKVFEYVAYKKGLNPSDHLISSGYNGYRSPNLRSLTDDEFLPTLEILVILSLYYVVLPDEFEGKKLDSHIRAALSNAQVDLGVIWDGSTFHKSGAENLDRALIIDPLKWLSEYPEAHEDYRKALAAFYTDDYENAIHSCYLSVEGLARKMLNNKKVLASNKDVFLTSLNLGSAWSTILAKYIEYANDYSRHASEKRVEIKGGEVEALIYLTGLLLRLASRSKSIAN